MLQVTYPRLKQYHLFLVGHLAESTTRDLKSDLIRTWEIFRWDSGGWDDYPAQVHTLDNNLDLKIACAAVTAHVIRSAHILCTAAEALGLEEDMKLYQSDIEELGSALQEHAWDADSGYFSYVVHDDQGNPIAHLRTEDGTNFNMGLDGIMPLFAGICSPEQETLLFERLANPERYWTPIGLSTVDMSAPYYSKSGYWNGAVWMPHQWFIWRTALDLGRPELAHQIAATALQLWKKEVETSYYCFEHFLIESGRGAGWHQFGALSSPVVSWFNAYFRPGQLSTGMNIWIDQQEFSEDLSSFKGKLSLMAEPRKTTVIINLKECEEISANWNETELSWKRLNPGSFQIEIPFTAKTGTLRVNTLGNL